jgi:hypothetical protein
MVIMSNIDDNALLYDITRFYTESSDFNGIPASRLAAKFNLSDKELAERLIPLIEEGYVSIVFGDIHPNPHIRALPDESAETQTAKLSTSLLKQACVYPLPTHLQEIVNPQNYEGKPYTLSLALGTPQLEFRPFDLSVLEYYRNDPRYYYANDDIRGSISVDDAYLESGDMPKSDQTVLQSFGFCYDSHLNRAVAVFVRHLADLSPQHQQVWKAKELKGNYLLHPEYYRNTILGDWGEKISIFEAFLEELRTINRMAEAMSRPHLFKQDFSEEHPLGILVS